MNPIIKKLAEDAGFAMWEDEPWRPEGAEIDWSSNYDYELQKFVDLFIKEIETYIQEAEGDIDYVRFLIDRNLK